MGNNQSSNPRDRPKRRASNDRPVVAPNPQSDTSKRRKFDTPPGPTPTPSVQVEPEIESEGPLQVQIHSESLDVSAQPQVPLTNGDPLLDDRLRTLSTILQVLGSDVASSLPDVVEAQRRASLSIDRPELQDLPPSTVNLLEEMETEALISESSLGESPAVSSLQSHGTIPLPRPVLPDRRRSRIGGLTERMGSWLGLNQDRTPPSGESQARSTTNEFTPPQPVIESNGPEQPTATVSRIPRGAVLIVQGFVQTLMPDDPHPTPPTSTTAASTPPLSIPIPSRTPTPPVDPVPSTSQSPFNPRPIPLLRSRLPLVRRTLSDINSLADLHRPSRDGQTTQSLPSTETPTPVPTPPVTSPTLSPPPPPEASSSTGRPFGRRIFGRPRNESVDPVPPFVEQAHMLAGLLSVTASATASSLLSPHPPPDQSQANQTPDPSSSSTPTSSQSGTFGRSRTALNAIRNRIQPSSPTPSSSHPSSGALESVLHEYMRNGLRSRDEGGRANVRTETSTDSAGLGGSSGTSTGASASANANTNSDETGAETGPRVVLTGLVGEHIAGQFDEFLHSMEDGLVRALREFNGDAEAQSQAPTASQGGDTPEPSSDQIETSALAPTDSTSAMATVETPVPTPTPTPNPTSMTTAAEPIEAERRPLRFSRIFQFPARQDAPPTTPTEPGQSTELIPVIIVGVRSVDQRTLERAHEESAAQGGTTVVSGGISPDEVPRETRRREVVVTEPVAVEATREEDLVVVEGEGSLESPFVVSEGVLASASETTPVAQVEQSDIPSSSDPTITSPPSARVQAQATPTPASLPIREPRVRFLTTMRALAQRREEERLAREAQAALAAETARRTALLTNNYVIWVVGGNYPPGHPVLAIPALVTGDLSHEDLWALAQALGQAKPPLASKEDIKKAGLEVVKGNEIAGLVENGRVRDMCLDRCLICLSDYEEEEECRIMHCQHAYHVPCIDRWLEEGRNNCPACRQTGVEVAREQGPVEQAAESVIPIVTDPPIVADMAG